MSPVPIKDPNAPPDPKELRETPDHQHPADGWVGRLSNPVPPGDPPPDSPAAPQPDPPWAPGGGKPPGTPGEGAPEERGKSDKKAEEPKPKK